MKEPFFPTQKRTSRRVIGRQEIPLREPIQSSAGSRGEAFSKRFLLGGTRLRGEG